MDYLDDAVKMGSTLSSLNEFGASLDLLEEVGKVPQDKRLGRDPLVIAHLKYYSVELKNPKVVPREAPPYTVAIVMALELKVCSEAFATLLSVWCSLRVDDLQSLDPQSIKLTTQGFLARLLRSKTTGPGKRHGALDVFIERSCSLTGVDWLQVGVNMLLEPELQFERDYMIPLPSKGWTGTRKHLAQPRDLSNFMRIVIQGLGTPRREGSGWRLNERMELVPGQLCMFWTGHSARHVLTQITASIGVSKEERNYLGRWQIGRTGSNAYILTMRQTVQKLQKLVVSAIVQGQPFYNEEDLLDSVGSFADARGLIGERIRRRHKVVPLGGDIHELGAETDEIASDADLEQNLENPENAVQSELDQESFRYFYTVSRKTGFRRLHTVGGCNVRAEKCQESVFIQRIADSRVDAVCKHCKFKVSVDEGEEENNSSENDESSSSSSSTSK